MNNTTWNISDEVKNFRYVGIAVGLTDILLGSLGNLLTIIVFSRSSSLRVSFNIFILNLAVIDLITSTLMMPLQVAGYVQMNWPIGGANNFTSSLQAFSYFCCGYSSIVCLMTITVNRFVSLQWPSKYEVLFSSRRVKLAVVLSWLIAPIFLLPFLLGSISPDRRIIGWKREQLLCTFVWLKGAWLAYMQVIRIIFQFLPIALMVAAYVIMFCKLRRSTSSTVAKETLPWERDKAANAGASLMLKGGSRGSSPRRARNDSQSTAISDSPSGSTSRRDQARSKMNSLHLVHGRHLGCFPNTRNAGSAVNLSTEEARIAKNLINTQKLTKEKRLLRVSAVICGAFILLFTPSLVVNLLPERRTLDVRIHMAASNITWLNSCINPFIYAIVNPKFRSEYKIFLKYFWLKFSCKL